VKPAARDLGDRVRAVHRRFPTGVTIVTTCTEGRPYGLAVNAFASISLDPPLVVACIAGTSQTYPHLSSESHLGINILSSTQSAIATTFARSGGDKFRGLAWRPGVTGVPVLDGVSAHLEVETQARIPAHTHTMFIGRVVAAAAADVPPLVYLAGDFFDGGELTACA
jgi:flavin reductase (DIM6/NTAB) family NADH-FMN oxidoreductase RutF